MPDCTVARSSDPSDGSGRFCCHAGLDDDDFDFCLHASGDFSCDDADDGVYAFSFSFADRRVSCYRQPLSCYHPVTRRPVSLYSNPGPGGADS